MENSQLDQSESESESQKEPSLFIVHEAFRCGGPYGVFSATCDSCLLHQFAMPVKIVAIFYGKGHLAMKLKKDLQLYAVKRGLPWFDGCVDDILTGVANVIEEDFDIQKCAHYASMEVGA